MGLRQADRPAVRAAVRAAEAELATEGPTPRAARVLLDMRTLHHDIAQLQEHLQGADFFAIRNDFQLEFQLKAGRR